MLSVVDTYTILKTFHVLFAVIWVGGGVAINVLGTRAVLSGSGERMATFSREAQWLGTHVYLPSSLLLLLFGILGVLEGHIGFTTTWVLLGLIGIGITIVTGSSFLGPQSKKAAQIIEARGAEDPEAKRTMAGG